MSPIRSRAVWLRAWRVAGNITGFTIGEKWLEVLKEIAPRLTQVVVLVDSAKMSPGFVENEGQMQC
jgi:hypothetical protein